MTWTRVAVVYGVLAILVGYLTLIDRPNTEPTANVVPAPPTNSLLGTDAATVRSLTLRKDGRTVRATREDGRWRALEPAAAHIPPDLFDAAIAALTAGQASEKLADDPSHGLADYGLDAPTATIEIAGGDTTRPPVSVLIGARNPTQTAVYALRSDEDAIYLVGMNLRYYIDLIFEAAAT
jgi:hypothetical protein